MNVTNYTIFKSNHAKADPDQQNHIGMDNLQEPEPQPAEAIITMMGFLPNGTTQEVIIDDSQESKVIVSKMLSKTDVGEEEYLQIQRKLLEDKCVKRNSDGLPSGERGCLGCMCGVPASLYRKQGGRCTCVQGVDRKGDSEHNAKKMRVMKVVQEEFVSALEVPLGMETLPTPPKICANWVIGCKCTSRWPGFEFCSKTCGRGKVCVQNYHQCPVYTTKRAEECL